MIRLFFVYALSGFVSLGYQVAWFRIFTDWFGSTNLTFALVVCNFIGGLGVGSLLSERLTGWAQHYLGVEDRLRLYGGLEIIIAITALGTLLVAWMPPDLWGHFPYHLRNGLWTQDLDYAASQVAIGGMLVFVPCMLMGVTFPLLCNIFVGVPGGSRFPAALYAWNTLGACSGVVACLFLLLPSLGHGLTFCLMVGINLSIGAYFLLTGGAPSLQWAGKGVNAATTTARIQGDRQNRNEQVVGSRVIGDPELATTISVAGLLACAVLSGLLAGALEGDMFRRVGFTVTSNPGAAMPAISFWVILGIFLASTLVQRLPQLGLVHIKIAFAVAVVYYFGMARLIYPVIHHAERSRPHSAELESASAAVSMFPASMLQLFLFIGWLVFVPYFLISLLLPYVCNHLQATRRHLGLAYGLNTLAFCMGLVGFTLVAPAVTIFYSFKLILVLSVCSVGVILVISERGGLSVWKPMLAVAVFLAGAVLTPAGFDRSMLNPALDPAEFPVEEVRSNGAVTTFVVRKPGDHRLYFGNQSMSGTNLVCQTYMRLMAHIPLLAQEHPTRALLICFGVGNTASAIAAHDTIEQIDAVDLNRQVFASAHAFADRNRDVAKDPRLRMIVDDGRNFLRLTDQAYDLVTSEPPPPMSSGVYRLYSREYYEDVLEHLTPGGMMTQWLPVYQMPGDAVRLAMATFLDVFPHALLFVGFNSELILVGSKIPLDLVRMVERYDDQESVVCDLRSINVNNPISLLARIMRTDASLREEYGVGPLISDQRNQFDRLFLFSDRLSAVTYDPREVFDFVTGQSAELGAEVAPVMHHLGRLRYRVPRFPLFTVAQDDGIPMSGADWRRITSLEEAAARRVTRGDSSGALRLLGRALELGPEHPELLLLTSGELAKTGQFGVAEQRLREFQRLEPADAAGHAALGSIFVQQGLGAEALGEFRRAVQLRPDWPPAMNNLGWILATHPDPLVRDPPAALKITDRAAQLTVYRDPLVLGTLAAAQAAAGEFSQAMTLAVRAVSLAEEAGLADVVDQTKQQLESYREGKAFIDRSLAKPVVNK